MLYEWEYENILNAQTLFSIENVCAEKVSEVRVLPAVMTF